MYNLTLFTIATGKYWNYFLRLLPEIQGNLNPDTKIHILVLTNQENCNFLLQDQRILLELVPIQDEPWPEITLLRYSKIIRYQQLIKGMNLMWLDVDTSIQARIQTDLLINKNSIYFTLHPGFQFTNFNLKELLDAKLAIHIKAFLKGLYKSKLGTYGWEFNRDSNAFVPVSKRRKYVFGTCWMGNTNSVLKMCEILSKRIDEDTAKGITAIWHDESHLNWYASNYKGSYLPRDFVCNPEWIWNSSKKARILALNKTELDKALKHL